MLKTFYIFIIIDYIYFIFCAGALPTTMPPRVIHAATHPHIPYGTTNQNSYAR